MNRLEYVLLFCLVGCILVVEIYWILAFTFCFYNFNNSNCIYGAFIPTSMVQFLWFTLYSQDFNNSNCIYRTFIPISMVQLSWFTFYSYDFYNSNCIYGDSWVDWASSVAENAVQIQEILNVEGKWPKQTYFDSTNGVVPDENQRSRLFVRTLFLWNFCILLTVPNILSIF